MPYFLSAQNLSQGKQVSVEGDELRHLLLSHRVKVGEKIKLQGPDGKRYLVAIIDISRYSLKARSLQEIKVPDEPTVKITLFQSVVSEKALDFIFQKGTELGVGKIILFNSQNTAVKLSADKFKAKYERWNKILIESAKQCERAVWPTLEFLSGVDEVMSADEGSDKVFLTDISGLPVKKFVNPGQSFKSCSILIGPEGGFTSEEISKFKTLANLKTISLGPILLRAETAALASIAIISQN